MKTLDSLPSGRRIRSYARLEKLRSSSTKDQEISLSGSSLLELPGDPLSVGVHQHCTAMAQFGACWNPVVTTSCQSRVMQPFLVHSNIVARLCSLKRNSICRLTWQMALRVGDNL